MTRTFCPKSLALTAVLSLCVVAPGAWTLSQTSLTGLGLRLGDGESQRLYQARFETNFPFTEALTKSWAALRLGLFGEPAEGAILGKDGTLFTAEEFAPPAKVHDLISELDIARAQIQSAGAELVPVIVPDKARMRADALPLARSHAYQARYDHVLADLERAGYRALDMRPALTGVEAYMITDTHWSPEGARDVAKSLAAALRDALPEPQAYVTVQTGTRAFNGDLTVFANTGPWRDLAGPVRETIATYATSAPEEGLNTSNDMGLGLFDTPSIPVVLVGTSFSARTDFHFDGFLRSHLGVDVLTHAMEGRGPFLPMTDFLNGSGLSEAQPTIVLWEIPERYLLPRSFSQ